MNQQDEIFKAFQKALEEKFQSFNSTPNPVIDNLSPEDLSMIIYSTFEENAPIGFRKEVSDDTLSQIPFLKLTIDYLNIVKQTETLKLTAKGNLPRKICLELYQKGYIAEEMIEKGIVKLNREGDSVVLQNLKIISGFAGLTKKKHNKLSLTTKGQKLLAQENYFEILQLIFKANFQKFNLGYHDGFAEDVFITQTFGYTLYLLLRYGQETRKVEFYVDKKVQAFPSILASFSNSYYSSPEESLALCYTVRYFERFLKFYGFVDYKRQHRLKTLAEDVNTTDLFKKVFEIRSDKFTFKKAKHSA